MIRVCIAGGIQIYMYQVNKEGSNSQLIFL